MKASFKLFLTALAVFATTTYCEDLKFSYTLASGANICFLQNIAESISGMLIFQSKMIPL